MKNHKAILVGTADKGLFYGFVPDRQRLEDIHGAAKVTLKAARMVVYHADVGGALGLAADGPKFGCRIGPAADEIVIGPVAGVAKVSDKAIKVWESFTWTP